MSDMSQFTGGAPKKWVANTTYQEGLVVWSPTDYQYFMRKTTGAGATDPVSDPTNWIPTGNRAIKSIQRGLSSNVATVTISSVDPAKSEVRWLGAVASDGVGSSLSYIRLINATTLSIIVNGGTSNHATSWEVTERY